MKICVCVGSSCHLKGAPEIIKILQEFYAHNNQENVEMSASFCQDKCQDGVVVSLDNVVYPKVKPENILDLLTKHLEGGA